MQQSSSSSSIERALKPIYQALDQCLYSRALKLTHGVTDWNITRALRAHCLQRLDRILPCLLELQSLISTDELQEKIVWLRLSQENDSNDTSLDVTEVIDLPDSRRRSALLLHRTPPPHAQPTVTDETTLATLAVTLRALDLHETLASMYKLAAETLLSSSAATEDDMREDLCHALHHAYQSHIRIESYPVAQWSALQLTKYSTSPSVHMAWCAHAALLHHGSSKVRNDFQGNMLPRLAESLLHKVLFDHADARPQHWKLYVQSLVLQNKRDLAISAIQNISTASTTTSFTERERLELMATICSPHMAKDIYSQQLLRRAPNQWSYWMSLLDACQQIYGKEEALQQCQEIIDQQQQQHISTFKGERGPCLFRVELASRCEDGTALSRAIVEYATMFGSLHSCFQDVRCYIDALVAKTDAFSEPIRFVLEWAHRLRQENASSLKNHGDPTSTDDDDGAKDQRTKLRQYIGSIQIVFEIWHELLSSCSNNNNNNGNEEGAVINEQMMVYVPSMMEMVTVWQNTLNLKSHSKDGGQKEVLPGDDLILLVTQLLLHLTPTCPVVAAALLERAMMSSPHNPKLKIAAIRVYGRCNATFRSHEIYKELGVKQIQYDSCSYLILPHLLDGGLYGEAVELSTHVLNLHATTYRDIGDYSVKALEIGNMSTSQEMMEFQKHKMRPSYQLLEVKGLIMDLATLITTTSDDTDYSNNDEGGNKVLALGALHGLCGGEEDVARANKMVRDMRNFYAAPSMLDLIHDDDDDASGSDHRDFTVNQFEILVRTEHATNETRLHDATFRAHVHGVLVRVVLLVQVTKPPKKGKLTRVTKRGEPSEKRADSVLRCIERTTAFVTKSGNLYFKEAGIALWQATSLLARVICTVCVGKSHDDSNTTTTTSSSMMVESDGKEDSLEEREKRSSQLLASTTLELNRARESLSLTRKRVCRLLPDHIVSLYTLVETTGKLFTAFGWNKRKRYSKLGAGALATTALTLRDILSDMTHVLSISTIHTSSLEKEGWRMEEEEDQLSMLASLFVEEKEETTKMFRRSMDEIKRSQQKTNERVLSFVNPMIHRLNFYDIPPITATKQIK